MKYLDFISAHECISPPRDGFCESEHRASFDYRAWRLRLKVYRTGEAGSSKLRKIHCLFLDKIMKNVCLCELFFVVIGESKSSATSIVKGKEITILRRWLLKNLCYCPYSLPMLRIRSGETVRAFGVVLKPASPSHNCLVDRD